MRSDPAVDEPALSSDPALLEARSPEVSVFTSTFNRAHTISRVWDSLCRQSFRNFEWVIIDDGSTDRTQDMVQEFCRKSDFPIRYYWQTNRGKHTAYNLFARHARADLFCSVDSDDEILPQCLERMLFNYRSIPADELNDHAGIWCLAQNQHGQLIGDRFCDADMGDSIVGVLLRHKKLGDKGGLSKVAILKEFPFPEDVERVYVPESYHIHAYTRRYKTKFVNEVLIQPWTDEAEEHLSNALSRRTNDAGSIYGLLAWPKYSMRYFWRRPKLFVAVTAGYVAMAIGLGKSFRQQFPEIESTAGRLLWLVTVPLGIGLLCARRLKDGRSIREGAA